MNIMEKLLDVGRHDLLGRVLNFITRVIEPSMKIANTLSEKRFF